MSAPLVITAAITGSANRGAENPHLPATRKAIVDAAVTSWRAGASVVHLHARDRDGTPTQDANAFRGLIERIRGEGCDAVLNLSTGSAGGRAELEERIQCLELRPEMATLDCGSMNFGDERVFSNPFTWLRDAAVRMKELGIAPRSRSSTRA
jgi:3-keto-5-aminohexanoate cleavage enzyme